MESIGTMDVFARLGEARDAFLSMNSGAPARYVGELLTGVHPRHLLMEPILVPFGVTLYLGLKPHFTLACRKLGTNGKSKLFKLFVLIHNLLLCAYSTWTASNVVLMTISHLRNEGVESVYCKKNLWHSGLHYWGFLFYLSKYWELVDTLLLIVKGRSPSYLQVYHHAVTIICAYALQVSHASVTFIFVGLNSTVHSIMYAYYALTVIGVRLKGKSLITSMQIVQFLSGIALACPMFFLKNGKCANPAQKLAVGVLILHAFYLTKLFVDFYCETYRRKAKAA
ncbi:fatty acid elongase [Chondrus crispus]|uniref:Elongation of fatty acids protein n=1 Tax=Chondrus crispus TaxID=2769 RepID=R7Q4A7_CHOCR|nr:fatty acid elongase [Chondrus crispus]CDF33357.1 fatty acid elongase [Chondrus crispus]|eukprot:XP_005713160.1 fatty acid elongase [Chondrus crispus]